jgi:hypothetical protein
MCPWVLGLDDDLGLSVVVEATLCVVNRFGELNLRNVLARNGSWKILLVRFS